MTAKSSLAPASLCRLFTSITCSRSMFSFAVEHMCMLHYTLHSLLFCFTDCTMFCSMLCFNVSCCAHAKPICSVSVESAAVCDYIEVSYQKARHSNQLLYVIAQQSIDWPCRTDGTNIKAFSLHPGSIATNLSRHMGMMGSVMNLGLSWFSKTIEQVLGQQQLHTGVCIVTVHETSARHCTQSVMSRCIKPSSVYLALMQQSSK